MENKVKVHIDSLYNKNLKVSVEEELKKIQVVQGESVVARISNKQKDEIKKNVKAKLSKKYDYSAWISKILIQDCTGSYFPSNHDEKELFRFLNLEIMYKRSFKSACDDGHPIIKELLDDLNLDEDLIDQCIERAKLHHLEPLDFFSLFEDELENDNLGLNGVCETVDKIAEEGKYGTIVSHPPKMTNPECKFPRIFAFADYSVDGFIRTGNSNVSFDIHINAVNLKTFKFLSLSYKDKALLGYVEDNNNKVFMELFGVDEKRSNAWVENFSKCLFSNNLSSNKYVRQVYFPVGDQYHLLSILTPSGLVFSVKEKVDFINDRSPHAYMGKKRKRENKYYGSGFFSIPNLTLTRHGGEHPKNISGLNNKHQTYYLLQSLPPKLSKRDIRFPKQNFFGESFRYYECREVFDALHKLFKIDYNNIRIREGRDYRLQDLIDRIIDKMWAVRSVSRDQYLSENSRLKQHQKIWLCHEERDSREESDGWLDKLCDEITAWIIRTYGKLLGKQAFMLGEPERLHIKGIVMNNKEALR